MNLPDTVEQAFADLELPDRRDLILKDATEWAARKPPSIQTLVRAYPLNQVYVIKAGAPYSVTTPKCIGLIIGYTEMGEVLFRIVRPSADAKRRPDGSLPIGVYGRVDPQWVQPITREEAAVLVAGGLQ